MTVLILRGDARKLPLADSSVDLIVTPPPSGPSLVLDPFGGTGTTAMVAKALGRNAITVDLSEDYCKMADWRIHHSGHGKKTEQRTWGERQGSLT